MTTTLCKYCNKPAKFTLMPKGTPVCDQHVNMPNWNVAEERGPDNDPYFDERIVNDEIDRQNGVNGPTVTTDSTGTPYYWSRVLNSDVKVSAPKPIPGQLPLFDPEPLPPVAPVTINLADRGCDPYGELSFIYVARSNALYVWPDYAAHYLLLESLEESENPDSEIAQNIYGRISTPEQGAAGTVSGGRYSFYTRGDYYDLLVPLLASHCNYYASERGQQPEYSFGIEPPKKIATLDDTGIVRYVKLKDGTEIKDDQHQYHTHWAMLLDYDPDLDFDDIADMGAYYPDGDEWSTFDDERNYNWYKDNDPRKVASRGYDFDDGLDGYYRWIEDADTKRLFIWPTYLKEHQEQIMDEDLYNVWGGYINRGVSVHWFPESLENDEGYVPMEARQAITKEVLDRFEKGDYIVPENLDADDEDEHYDHQAATSLQPTVQWIDSTNPMENWGLNERVRFLYVPDDNTLYLWEAWGTDLDDNRMLHYHVLYNHIDPGNVYSDRQYDDMIAGMAYWSDSPHAEVVYDGEQETVGYGEPMTARLVNQEVNDIIRAAYNSQKTASPWNILPQVIEVQVIDDGHGHGHPWLYMRDSNIIYVGDNDGAYHYQLMDKVEGDSALYELGSEPEWYSGGRYDPKTDEFYANFSGEGITSQEEALIHSALKEFYNSERVSATGLSPSVVLMLAERMLASGEQAVQDLFSLSTWPEEQKQQYFEAAKYEAAKLKKLRDDNNRIVEQDMQRDRDNFIGNYRWAYANGRAVVDDLSGMLHYHMLEELGFSEDDLTEDMGDYENMNINNADEDIYLGYAEAFRDGNVELEVVSYDYGEKEEPMPADAQQTVKNAVLEFANGKQAQSAAQWTFKQLNSGVNPQDAACTKWLADRETGTIYYWYCDDEYHPYHMDMMDQVPGLEEAASDPDAYAYGGQNDAGGRYIGSRANGALSPADIASNPSRYEFPE